MPSINVGEEDFTTVAMAAMNAKSRGDMDEAHRLDKIARKINAALTSATTLHISKLSGMPRQTVRWQDMPSCLGDAP